MSYYRRAKLVLHIFHGFTSRIVTKDVSRKPISTLYSSPVSSKPKFTAGFSSASSSWHKPILQLGRITRSSAQHSPFSGGCTNRYYHRWESHSHRRPGWFRTKWEEWYAWVREDYRRLRAARFLGFGVFIALCLGRLETIPYSKRTHFVLVRSNWDKMLGDHVFEEMKIRGSILSDWYPQTRRVRRIVDDITQGSIRGISREDHDKDSRRWWWRLSSRVATSHLENLKWEIYVVNQPDVNAFCLPGGKIVVFTGLLNHFTRDEELATILGHEVGHVVARHGAENITNNIWIYILQLIFFQFFTGGVATQMEMEADYIGLLLLASAGYDPRVAPGVYQKFSEIAGETPNQKDYLSTHPTGKKRAEKLGQANVMEEALSIYQDVQAGRRKRTGFLRR